MNETRIEHLRQIIYRNLDPHINSDYCLLDVPSHENIGDNLIWQGELEYLRRLPYKMLYTANSDLCNFTKVKKAGTILLQGGGNFGDLWEGYQPFRRRVISAFPDKKIILFPQSVHYSSQENLKKDIELFNRHPNLVLCARDEHSYRLFKTHFTATVLLVPDMAFCLQLLHKADKKTKKRTLILKRKDKELNKYFDEFALYPLIEEDSKVDTTDWPTFAHIHSLPAHNTPQKKFSLHRVGISKIVSRLPLLNRLVDDCYGFVFKRRRQLETYVESGINFINQYDTVFSTRLHVFILSVLLEKKVFILDNSYGKNKGLYDTWMKDFENLYFLEYSSTSASTQPAIKEAHIPYKTYR